ncbi:MAG: glycosyltransferase [archaeon]|nr:glycosyltransferase [archaeon]
MTTEQKKILVVSDTYRPKVDGTIHFIDQFCKRTHKNVELTLLVPKFGNGEKSAHANTLFLKTSKIIVPLPTYPSMALSRENFKIIKKNVKINDIIFVQGPAIASMLATYYGWRYKKRVVTYLHVLPWELFRQSQKTLFRLFTTVVEKVSVFFYNRSNFVLVPYYELEESMTKLGVKRKMYVAKLGVDIDKFSPSKDKRMSKKKMGIDSEEFVVGYVGRISQEKNLEVLKEAFDRLDYENKRLLIVGDGAEEQKTILKSVKNCQITGFVNNVEDYLKAMDVFVQPSHTETTSLATLEAMACGLPVIVSKVGFMKQYISKDHNGLFFPKSSPMVLASKITKIHDDLELRKKLSDNARKTVAYSFSWERSINRIKKLLLE